MLLLWTLCHTIQLRAILIIFPLNLHTITITQMSSGLKLTTTRSRKVNTTTTKHCHSIHTNASLLIIMKYIPVAVSLLTRRPSRFLSCCSLSIKSSRCCEPVFWAVSCFLLSSHCAAKLSRSWNMFHLLLTNALCLNMNLRYQNIQNRTVVNYRMFCHWYTRNRLFYNFTHPTNIQTHHIGSSATPSMWYMSFRRYLC